MSHDPSRRLFLKCAAVAGVGLLGGCGFQDLVDEASLAHAHPSWSEPHHDVGLTLRVTSYNIAHYRGRDEVQDAHRTAQVLAQLQADVIALQETDNGPDAVTGMPRLELLAERTGTRVVELPGDPPAVRFHRNSVLSRYPVREVRVHDVSVKGRDPRGIVDVEVETEKGIVRVINTHLGLNKKERRFQMHELVELLYAAPRHQGVVVMGDFNEWWSPSANLRYLEQHLGDSSGPATFPSGSPVFQLDRIWTNPTERQFDLHVPINRLTRIASDHLPICAHVEF